VDILIEHFSSRLFAGRGFLLKATDDLVVDLRQADEADLCIAQVLANSLFPC
jgi:hypothetical protein